MRFCFRLSFLFFVSSLCYSCNRGNGSLNENAKEGLVKKYSEDGRLVQEIEYKQGKKNGVVTDYYKNGKVFQIAPYVNDVKQGVVKRFYEDGVLLRETPYENGVLHGVEKKYRQDGKLAFEAPYYYGNPTTGLKEYLRDGSLKTTYPFIVVTPIDKTLLANKYTLRISMSDHTTAVQYFSGVLKDGRYIDKKEKILLPVNKGVYDIDYYLGPGDYVMERLNILAKVKTVQGNYYITQCHYNVAADNR